MTIKKSYITIVFKLALLIWGALSLLQGAGLGFFVNGPHQYRYTYFLSLVYESVFAAALISFFSGWIASLMMLVSAIAAVVMLWSTQLLGHPPQFDDPFLIAIALRPALGCLVLFILTHWDKEPTLKSKLRSLVNLR